MRILGLQNGLITLAAVAVLAVWGASCNDSADIVGTDSSFEGLKSEDDDKDDKKKKSKNEDGIEYDEDGNVIMTRSGGSDEDGTADNTETDSGIEYPAMDLSGNGVVTCKGTDYQTQAKFTSSLAAGTLELNMYHAQIFADKDKAEEEANRKIQENTGITRYTRPTKAERRALIDSGFDWAPYLIFAKSVTKERQGQSFEFSAPLPVFPWPAPVSRYAELDKGPKKWTAQVTGSASFTVTVTIEKVSQTDSSVDLKFSTEIAEDQPGTPNHRSLYEIFPMSREMIQTVNATERDVRSIRNTSWFKGDECDGRPEEVRMTYILCKKTTSQKTEQFSCP